jgi:hypothetical protein
MILSGQHTLCNAVVPSVVIQEYIHSNGGITGTGGEHEKTKMMIFTLNCAGKQPETYRELLPIFQSSAP